MDTKDFIEIAEECGAAFPASGALHHSPRLEVYAVTVGGRA